MDYRDCALSVDGAVDSGLTPGWQNSSKYLVESIYSKFAVWGNVYTCVCIHT